MEREVARVAREALIDAKLGGVVDVTEPPGSKYWHIWYSLPNPVTVPDGRRLKVVILIAAVGAKLYRKDEEGLLLAGEVCTSSGGTLFDPGVVGVTPEGAAELVHHLVSWVKERDDQPAVLEVEPNVELVDTVSEVFNAAGLSGRVYRHASPSLEDVMYVLDRRDGESDAVLLTVSITKSKGSPVIEANACWEESGATLFEVPSAPWSAAAAREAAKKLVDWAKGR